MKWVAWRQSRLELIMGLVVLAGLAAFLVPVGLQKLALFKDLGLPTISSTAAGYDTLSQQFLNSYQRLNMNTVVTLISFAPLIIGALLAVPIIIEFEQRTYRLAWTQSVTRGRWMVTKFGFALIAAVVFSALLSVLMRWWLAPQESLTGPFNNFFQHGIVPLAYAVFALAVALAVGALSRRTTLAVILALVVCVAAVAGVGSELRPHYMTPVEQVTTVFLKPPLPTSATPSAGTLKIVTQIPDGAWVVDQYFIDASGNRLSNINMQMLNGSTQDTLRQVVEYQPAYRYWPFQGIEASIFFGMSAMLLGTTVGVVKRRMR